MRSSRRGWKHAARYVAVGWFALYVGFLVWRSSDSVVAGVIAALASTVGFIVFMRWMLRRAAQRAAAISADAPKIEGRLDTSCLPGDWPSRARETMGALGGQASQGLAVIAAISDGYLTIDKRRILGSGRNYPFTARVPLSAIDDVTVSGPRFAVVGSTLTFSLRNGEEVRVEIGVEGESAERVAAIFRSAIDRAPMVDTDRLRSIEPKIERDPPVRTTPAWTMISYISVVPAWVIAMLGFHNGRAAGTALSVAFFVGLGSIYFRPPWLPRLMAVLLVAGGVGFVVDAITLNQPLRLAGTVYCVGFAAWLSRKYSSGGTLSRPA